MTIALMVLAFYAGGSLSMALTFLIQPWPSKRFAATLIFGWWLVIPMAWLSGQRWNQ